MTIACDLIAGSVAEHVGMHLERKARFLPCPFYHPIEAIRGEWSVAFANE